MNRDYSVKKTFIYVDGFNLYYRATRRHDIKWVNLYELCRLKLHKDNEIRKIKYFAALTRRSRGPDKSTHIRQQVFLRALRTLPNLEIIMGTFHQQEDYRILADSPSEKPEKVKVVLPEEKGSDVNLAVHMVDDAHRDRYDLAIVVSNDSDLIGAVKAVREIGKLVGVICPSETATPSLERAANFTKIIGLNDLRNSEFPRVLRDDEGEFHRPAKWDPRRGPRK